jgi:uroporphyrinogen-III synthase
MTSIRTTSAVLVCKEYSDAYEIALEARGFQPYFIQVLATNFVGVERLQHAVWAGPEQAFSGVIVTSSRGADAWTHVVHRLLELDSDDTTNGAHPAMHRPCCSDSRQANSWSGIPFYAVGKATEKSLKACPPCKYSPALILGANETGSGEALAHYILKHHGAYNTSLPLLYLTGDKNRDTVPVTLDEGGLKTTPMQVYETGKRDGLEADLKAIISTILSSAFELLNGTVAILTISYSFSTTYLACSILPIHLRYRSPCRREPAEYSEGHPTTFRDCSPRQHRTDHL